MRTVAACLCLGVALVAAPGAAHARRPRQSESRASASDFDAFMAVLLLGFNGLVSIAYAHVGGRTSDGESLSTSDATALLFAGGVLGAATMYPLVTSQRRVSSSNPVRDQFWGGLAPPLVGMAGLGIGGYGLRPRDPWIGATSMVTAVTATHAILAWTGRGDRPFQLVVGAVYGVGNAVGTVALALTSETELESALLWTSAGLSLASAASLVVSRTRIPAPPPPQAQGRTPAALSWSAGPVGRGAGVFLSGVF